MPPLLEVDNLQVQFQADDGIVRAVNGVSFSLQAGETLGIVGESGSGKSVTSLAIMGLIPQPPGKVVGGQIRLDGRDLLTVPAEELRKVRGKRIAMIFQDPMTALNPFLTIEEQLTEVTRLHLGFTAAQARKHAIELLERVEIPAAGQRIDDYPHQLSGGMRQRVMIAMALSCKPDILIADEPTTALDVTIQAQILDLIRELQRQDGMAVLLITHALGVVASVCERVLVMYAGQVAEEASVDSLFANPRHPYSLALLRSMPSAESRAQGRLPAIEGQPPNMADAKLPPGCRFCPRCSFKIERCVAEMPELRPRVDGGQFRCFVEV